MIEQLRILGITMGLTGTGIMENMIRKQVKTNQLSDKEIQAVLYAWDSRNFVPRNKKGKIDVDIVSPIITKEEVENGLYSQEEYDRNYVEMIEKYLQTIM